jgi:hypothetical protein
MYGKKVIGEGHAEALRGNGDIGNRPVTDGDGVAESGDKQNPQLPDKARSC